MPALFLDVGISGCNNAAQPAGISGFDGLIPTPAGISTSYPAPTNLTAMKTFELPPKSREYIHDECGQRTTIDGDEFLSLCDPRYEATQTFCCHCSKQDKLSSFRWADSNESLIEYRRKLAGLIPMWVHVVGANWLFAVWIVLAGCAGFGLSQFVTNFKIAYGIPAVIFFAIAMACDLAGKASTSSLKFHQFK